MSFKEINLKSVTKTFVYITVIFVVMFGISQTTNAQFNLVGQTEVSLEIYPEIPNPNTQVRATIQSYGTNLDMASISWYLNDKKELSGKGEKVFYFNTGSINTTTDIKVIIETQNGETLEKSYSVKPTEVDIIWQSESYTHPFYKGKALFSPQNKITFIALPRITNSNGTEINPSNLVYKWKRNGNVLESFSGYGKNTYTYIQEIISRPLFIEVEVTSSDDRVAYSSIYIKPTDPIIVFYEKSPLYGFIFEKSLNDDVSLENKKEIEILVVPYFFGTKTSQDQNLSYKWSINNQQVDNDLSKTSRVFRPKEGESGLSKISVSIENANKVLQSVSSSFNLEFNNNQ